MVSFDRIAENKIQLTIDTIVFNDTVVTKTLYWIQGYYFVFWNSLNGDIQNIVLERKDGTISDEDFFKLKNQINQNLILKPEILSTKKQKTYGTFSTLKPSPMEKILKSTI